MGILVFSGVAVTILTLVGRAIYVAKEAKKRGEPY